MGYQVILSPRSIRDLEETVRYIAPHNPSAAKALGLALIARTKVLSEFPEMGRVVPEFGLPSIREIIFKSYRIVYRLNHESRVVEVSRFWHGARGAPDLPPSE
jgi:plasmid stabilization system protein ParE